MHNSFSTFFRWIYRLDRTDTLVLTIIRGGYASTHHILPILEAEGINLPVNTIQNSLNKLERKGLVRAFWDKRGYQFYRAMEGDR